ncbi:putative transcription factor homeobox-WOX family [Lupinus albus]|uniref:Putative transcription factor homeobox-WOX family n=1 Tax=Lupinus albus TaxID=3870 RepID=A0A6A4PF23_LUPAL|nr:putative transcription factor homeobox-WOX family [Lupinus albus]
MGDQGQHDPTTNGSEKSEPVRSRWTPKPEQIHILESIFNSGMVNPPKDETIRIRKLLQKFGTVGDANVFYWFQNRRSRSRRRQRQLQASLDQRNQMMKPSQVDVGAIPYHKDVIGPSASATTTATATTTAIVSASSFPDSSSPCGEGGVLGGEESIDSFFSLSSQMSFPQIGYSSAATSVFYPPVAQNFSYQCGFITVFVNGVATEVPNGPIDMKTVFGEDVMLVHSSGMPLPTNEFGFLMQTLQLGESYFLVSSFLHIS